MKNPCFTFLVLAPAVLLARNEDSSKKIPVRRSDISRVGIPTAQENRNVSPQCFYPWLSDGASAVVVVPNSL